MCVRTEMKHDVKIHQPRDFLGPGEGSSLISVTELSLECPTQAEEGSRSTGSKHHFLVNVHVARLFKRCSTSPKKRGSREGTFNTSLPIYETVISL